MLYGFYIDFMVIYGHVWSFMVIYDSILDALVLQVDSSGPRATSQVRCRPIISGDFG